jgi:hypothetical protein
MLCRAPGQDVSRLRDAPTFIGPMRCRIKFIQATTAATVQRDAPLSKVELASPGSFPESLANPLLIQARILQPASPVLGITPGTRWRMMRFSAG